MTNYKMQFELLLKSLCKKHRFELIKEYKFCPNRKWAFDYVIGYTPIKIVFELGNVNTIKKIAFEYDGGVYQANKGRHTNAVGYSNDCEKINMATAMGWQVYRFTAIHIQQKSKEIEKFINAILTNNIENMAKYIVK